MSAHTPGPWEIEAWYGDAGVNDGSHKNWSNPRIPVGECAFCHLGPPVRTYTKDGGNFHTHRGESKGEWRHVYGADGTQITGTYDYEEGGVCTSEADARLIAAAPEMLTALRAYLAARPQCKCTDAIGCKTEGARVLARAAIAKAEGRPAVPPRRVRPGKENR